MRTTTHRMDLDQVADAPAPRIPDLEASWLAGYYQLCFVIPWRNADELPELERLVRERRFAS